MICIVFVDEYKAEKNEVLKSFVGSEKKRAHRLVPKKKIKTINLKSFSILSSLPSLLLSWL